MKQIGVVCCLEKIRQKPNIMFVGSFFICISDSKQHWIDICKGMSHQYDILLEFHKMVKLETNTTVSTTDLKNNYQLCTIETLQKE